MFVRLFVVCSLFRSPRTMSSPKCVIQGSLVLWGCTETYCVDEVNLSSSNDYSTYAIQFQNKLFRLTLLFFFFSFFLVQNKL